MPRYESMIPGEVQAYIVMRLAHFTSNSQVRKEILERFEVDATLQQLSHYNPTNASAARNLSKELKELFWDTRKEFLEKIENIPIANAAVRLRRLNRLADKAQANKDIALEALIIEQAAKEVGGMFQNTRRILGKAVGNGTGMIVPVFMVPDNGRDLPAPPRDPEKRPRMLSAAAMMEGVEVLDGADEPGAGGEGMAGPPSYDEQVEDYLEQKVGELDAAERDGPESEWDQPQRAFDAPEEVKPIRKWGEGL